MAKSTDIAVKEARFSTEPLPYRAPLKFGGRVVSGAEIMNVSITVETKSGKSATGFGSMPVGNVWAWPSSKLEPDQTAEAVKLLAERMCQSASELTGFAHPLDHVRNLHESYLEWAKGVESELELNEEFPSLAVLLSASPVDAALHDGFGRANEINSFNGLGAEFVSHDLSKELGFEFAGEYLDRYTLRTPKPRIPLYHLVGAIDPLTVADVTKPLADGLPETLMDWIPANGLTHLKIKLNGDDLAWDVDRVVSVNAVAEEAQSTRGCTQWWYSLDFNEKCRDVNYVLEFLAQVKERAAAALERVQYIEQPTHRDLKKNPQNRMHKASAIKPVVIDESLVDIESLYLAREQGYSGVALKSCKGQTEALFAAAVAQKLGMFLCVQDLTCPGASFLHSAELAARIPAVAAIEGNARQYCPVGNVEWAKKYPTMFNITDGSVGTSVLTENGLGHSLD